MAFTYSNRNFGDMPRPGELREHIRIGRTEAAQNENGYAVNTDVYICRVFAKVERSGYNQTHDTGANVVMTAMNFSIRFREDIVSGMWVEYRGERWIIIDTYDYEARRAYLGVRTMKAQEVSG